jgi:hypothetical protein
MKFAVKLMPAVALLLCCNTHAADKKLSASSPQPSGRDHSARDAVDGDWKTYWQTDTGGNADKHPHELVVDLGKKKSVYGFVYVPVPYSRKGRILNYEVFVSSNKTQWGDPVHTGTFQQQGGGFWPDTKEKMARVFFQTPEKGRYIKLKALSEVDGRPITSVAEFAPITDKSDYLYKDTTLALLKGTRLAPSVHLNYGMPEATEYYIEATIEDSAPGSYFMTIGFAGGYFGIQELSNGGKVVIFSVWDDHRGDNPNAVPEEKRVKNPYTGEAVRVKRFGGEGTGGQSFFKYDWKVGTTYKFLAKTTTVGDWTEYTGYFYMTEQKQWKKLVTFSTYSGGQHLKRFHSFVEDFQRDFDSHTRVRKARFTNGWVKDLSGGWKPVKNAKFTRDGNPHVNIDAGPTEEGFFLQTGGDSVNKTTKLWSSVQTSPSGNAPTALP